MKNLYLNQENTTEISSIMNNFNKNTKNLLKLKLGRVSVYISSVCVALFVALLLLMPAKGAWGQTEVTIGTGTDTQRYPLGNYFGYERGVALYTATDIGSAGNITKLSFYIDETYTTSHPIKIYLKTQTATTLTANTYASFTSGAILVYEANVSHPSTGWQDFNLTTPFAYDGTSSLLVIIETNYGGSGWGNNTAPKVRYTTSESKFLYWYQDNSIPTGNGTASSNRPNIKLVIGSCTPKYTSTGDHITNFTLGTINNTTTYSTNNYSNYTNLSTTLMPGSSYNASLTSSSGSGTHAAAIWIDFNDNGVFETSERVGMLDGIGASQTVTIPITIPTNAPSGSHTLRVIYQWNVTAENLDPCASATYGEGEDYTIIIPDCTLPTVYFPQSSYSHTLGGGGFTAPTLTNNGGTATYSSSNTAVATVNASTGAITIIGEGSTTITANTASTSTYCAGSASYTLNVVCPTMVAPTTNGALAYEMLEGFMPGSNLTWGLAFQRQLANGLQININYNARKSPDSKIIHNANVQVRAFF